jgi:hypothetical protein
MVGVPIPTVSNFFCRQYVLTTGTYTAPQKIENFPLIIDQAAIKNSDPTTTVYIGSLESGKQGTINDYFPLPPGTILTFTKPVDLGGLFFAGQGKLIIVGQILVGGT